MAGVATELYETIERTVQGLGYELVDVERLAAGLLRVTLDKPDGSTDSTIALEDCERVSRQLSHLFAVEDVDYQRLEVSSPGLDRPLKRVRDFERHVGAEVELQLFAPIVLASGARRKLRGRLRAVGGEAGRESVRIEMSADGAKPAARGAGKSRASRTRPAETLDVALSDVEKAKLVPELDFRPGRRNGKSGADEG